VSRDAEGDPTGPPPVLPVEPGDRAPIGLRIQGRYRIAGELGAGPFGTVCLAEDEATGHRVAIRLLPQALAAALHAAQPVRHVGLSMVAASTAHPGLAHVLEFGEVEHGRPFVAMELVEGRRLSEILSGGTPLDVGAALRLALDLGGAVETLHNMGLVHGALRPRNVMVLADWRVKLMDLELIGLRDAGATKSVHVAEPPAEYLSPDQVRRAPLTEGTDIYAFAVILYEMLYGAPPLQAATREAVLAKHLTETPALVRRRRAVPVPEKSQTLIHINEPTRP
jgi:serine/threonine protein kinase